jgi:hypothetical protein
LGFAQIPAGQTTALMSAKTMKTKLYRWIFKWDTAEILMISLLILLLVVCDLAVFANPGQ